MLLQGVETSVTDGNTSNDHHLTQLRGGPQHSDTIAWTLAVAWTR